MTYLTAHRSSAVRKYGGFPGSSRPSNLPAPYRPALRPPGANDNIPRPANTNIPKRLRGLPLSPRGLRAATRLPWFIFDEFAYEFLKEHEKRLAASMTPIDLTNWFLQNVCTTLTPTHYTTSSGFCNAPGSNGVCFTGSNASTAVPIGTPFPAVGCRLALIRHTHSVGGTPRYAAVSYYWRFSANNNHSKVARVFQPANIMPRPVFDPNTLPILWPVPLPTPIPFVLVPARLDDPLGSTRNNGDTRPVIHPPRPPPPRTKEVKLRAMSGVVGVLQKLHHATTEALDYLDSFHDALPAGYKAKSHFVAGGLAKFSGWRPASPQDKIAAILKNFDKLDWNEVVKNLIQNEIEDRILGRANAGANKALTRRGVTRGFAF